MKQLLTKVFSITLLLLFFVKVSAQQAEAPVIIQEALISGKWVKIDKKAQLSVSNPPESIRLQIAEPEKADKQYVFKYLWLSGEGSVPDTHKESDSYSISKNNITTNFKLPGIVMPDSMSAVKEGSYIAFEIETVYYFDKQGKIHKTNVPNQIFSVAFTK
jgi:hypothetical protein